MISLDKKYVTRGGEAVRLVSDKGNGKFPFIGLTGDYSIPKSWTKEGCYYEDGTPIYLDLVEVKEPKILKCWVNFYTNGGRAAFGSKEIADDLAHERDYCRIGEAVEVTKEVFE